MVRVFYASKTESCNHNFKSVSDWTEVDWLKLLTKESICGPV